MEAVDLISDGKAPKIPQPEEGATYDKIWKKKEVAKVCIINMLLIIYFHEELFQAVTSSIYCYILFLNTDQLCPACYCVAQLHSWK